MSIVALVFVIQKNPIFLRIAQSKTHIKPVFPLRTKFLNKIVHVKKKTKPNSTTAASKAGIFCN